MKFFKHLFALIAVLVVCVPTKAQTQTDNLLSVENVEVGNYDVFNIPINLTNVDEIGGVQFDIVLPDFLEFAGDGTPYRTDRTKKQTVEFKNGRVLMSSEGMAIKGNSGAILEFPVRVKSTTSGDVQGTLSISNITLSGMTTGIQTAPKYTQDKFTVSVAFKGVNIQYSASPVELFITPGKTAKFAINYKSNADFYGFEASFILPEGLTVDDYEVSGALRGNVGYFNLGSVGNGMHKFRITYNDRNLNPISGEGEFFTITLQADKGYTLADGTITMTDILSSYTKDGDVTKSPDVTISLTNLLTAYERLNAKLTVAETTLADALKTIAEEYPAVKDQFLGTEIANTIADIRTRVDAAYNDGSILTAEAGFNTEIENVGEAINALVLAAEAANQTIVDNDKAYGRLMEAWTTLDATVGQMAEALKTDAPNVWEQFPLDPIATEVAEIKTAIDASKEAGTCVADEKALSDRIAAAVDALNKLKQAADEAQHAYNSNKAAYDELIAAWTILNNDVKSMGEAIATDCPNVAEQFPVDPIATTVAEIQAKIEAANEEGTCVSQYEALMAEIKAASDALMKLHEDAVLAQQKYTSNKVAYDMLQDELTVARESLDATMASIKEDCPDVADRFSDAEIAAKIAAIAEEVEAANKAQTCKEDYEALSAKISALAEDLEALKAAAVAAEEQYKAEQAAAANKAAYERLTAAWTELDATVGQMAEAIKTDFPNVWEQYPVEPIANEVAAIKTEIENSNENGTCVRDEEAIMAKMEAAVAALEKLQADASAAQQQYIADNKAAYDSLIAAWTPVNNDIANMAEAIKTDAPNVWEQFPVEPIAAEIAAIKAEIESSNEALTCVADKAAIMAKIEAAAAALAKLHADAVVAQQKYNADQAAAANKAAYDELIAAWTILSNDVKNTAEAIATDAPNVAAQFPVDPIATTAAEIKAKIEAANEDGACVSQKEALLAEIAAANKALEKLHTDAVEAQQKYNAEQAAAANKAAYDELIAAWTILNNDVKNIADAIADDAPNVAAQFPVDPIATTAAEIKAKIEAANEDGACVSQKEALLAEIKAASDALMKLHEDAVLAQQKYTSNKVAYDMLQDELKVARQSLADMMASIKEDCPDVADRFSDAEIAAKIAAIAEEVEAANKAQTCKEDYETLSAKISALAEDLEALKAAAVAAEEQYKADQAAAANKAAYDRLMANVKMARETLADMREAIEKDYADVADKFTGDEIEAKINAIEAEIEKYNALGTCPDHEEDINAQISALADDFDALQAAAAAAQALYNRNMKAYEGVEAEIDALQAELDAMKAFVTENYPDAPVASYIYVAQDAINKAREGAEKALDDANEQGKEYEYTFDKDYIKALIKEIEQAAKALGISDVLIEGVDASTLCDVYALTGSMIRSNVAVGDLRDQLASGVYIVKANGNAYKIIIR